MLVGGRTRRWSVAVWRGRRVRRILRILRLRIMRRRVRGMARTRRISVGLRRIRLRRRVGLTRSLLISSPWWPLSWRTMRWIIHLVKDVNYTRGPDGREEKKVKQKMNNLKSNSAD
jgi:hypothetical protein